MQPRNRFDRLAKDLGQEALGPSGTTIVHDEIMAMYKTWEEGRTEARTEGRTEKGAEDVLTVLRARGIAVSDAARARILAQQDLDQLTRWLEKAVVASSLEEVIGDPR
jgi:hypothetical protein